jgi:hypothetical protein
MIQPATTGRSTDEHSRSLRTCGCCDKRNQRNTQSRRGQGVTAKRGFSVLRELGVDADGLTVAEGQSAGLFALDGHDPSGRALLVKVYGRDAYDTQLASKVWRTVLYQDAGPPLRLG